MTQVKRSDFQSLALQSKLVTSEQLAEALESARERDRDALVVAGEDEVLAAELIRRHLVTAYQVAQLQAGRARFNLGPYVITDWIGQGGMGQVFKAVHRLMGRECAVKVLPQEKSTPEAIASFAREIRTQAKLDHPNLVRAYDAGHDGNVYYLVVEYVPGADLRRLARAQKRLTMQQAASVIMQAALGLEHAHQQGLVHRDVKPGNILVSPDGQAKVSDLGLAGAMLEGDEDPRRGKIVGTADYIAPELVHKPRDILPVSDIYSLGCTLYYAITGKVPFPGGAGPKKILRHCEETPIHPRHFAPELTEDFVELLADMMEKDPRRRLQTMAEVAHRLEPWASRKALPSQTLGKSPWLPPPPPSERPGDEAPTEVGAAVIELEDAQPAEHASQPSLGATPSAGVDETWPWPTEPPPPPLGPQLTISASVAITLAVAVPLALLLGGVIGFLLGLLAR